MLKQILVVDDNMASLKQVGALLAGNYDFFLTKSGAEALAICQMEKPDLVLLDVNMPDMSGFETIAKIKSIDGMAGVPVIFLTGDLDAKTEVKALEAGAVDYVTKPADKSILLHRIKLHLELYDYQTNLVNTKIELQNAIVASYADLVDCKDRSTGCHVLRVAKIVELLGGELIRLKAFPDELNASSLDLMVQGAPFHDIGKIGISDTILRKPAPLSDDEYDIVKGHTIIGNRVLKTIHQRSPELKYLKYAYMMAEGHHERYDGRGYPYGLAGERVPLCSRLLSVANVYDACRADRPYRWALDHDVAIGAIIAGKGTEFDAQIADAFVSIAESFKALY